MRLLVIEHPGAHRAGAAPAPGKRPVSRFGAALRAGGFDQDVFGRLAEGAEAVATVSYQALLLDWRLPDGCAAAWLRGQRAAGLPTPALVLAEGASGEARIAALEAGGDDCVGLPGLSPRELVARLRALVRRPPVLVASVLKVGDLRLDTAARTVAVRGCLVPFPRRELGLLELLMRSHGRVLTRPMLEADLYGHAEEASPNSLEVRVSRVRHRLAAAGSRVAIRTVRGVGYTLAVGAAQDPRASAVAAALVEPAGSRTD